MKKLCIMLFLLNIVFNSKAQIKIGAQVGILNAGAKYSDAATTKKSNGIIGYKIGINISDKISKKISFIPELNYVVKGAKFVTNSGLGTIPFKNTSTFKMNYLELPLNAVFYSNKSNLGVYLGGGPVISYGIGGKGNYVYEQAGIITNNNSGIKFDGKTSSQVAVSDKDIHFKGLEFGGNIFLGYKLKNKFDVKLMYNQGFSNISTDNTTFKNNYFGLTLSHSF